MVFDNIEATFEFDPCVQDVTRMKYWSLDPYQHDKIIKPVVSFQLIKL